MGYPYPYFACVLFGALFHLLATNSPPHPAYKPELGEGGMEHDDVVQSALGAFARSGTIVNCVFVLAQICQ